MKGLNLIVAMDRNGLIGKDNELPWKIPEDLKYFKEKTKYNVVVMGRNTHDSIPKLKDRIGFVISGDPDYNHKWGVRLWSFEQFLPWITFLKGPYKKDNIFIIGGASIYKQAFKYCDKLFITYVNDTYEGNKYFPISFSKINEEFKMTSRKISDKTGCEYIIMERIKNEV
jgi:dihydrofolate reductase